MTHIRTILTAFGLLVLVGTLVYLQPFSTPAYTQEGTAMPATTSERAAKPQIPPLDAAASATTETATFALG